MTKAESFIPPYLSWRSFTGAWEHMASQDTLPAVIDRSYLKWMSGTTQTSFLGMLRQFDLVDDQDRPTGRLRELVYDPDSRPRIIGEQLHEHYEPIVEMGKMHATTGQLNSTWREIYGQEGDTRNRAINFFLQAAELAGIPLSPEWTKGMPTPAAAAPRQRRRSRPAAKSATRAKSQSAENKSVLEVKLASGVGRIAVTLEADFLHMSDEDRAFVFGISDALRDYQAKHADEEASGPDEGSEDQ
ncbi:DUF5343 domain-containing protein [Saccharopolyspora sp. HNM0986]|uniref:DUF5343 domain-containing protein n=1 Tax=Saccharopolyspora galaxeae TaxID=2781241 RepID=UPI00190D14BE|nr:DUF5343 domain-containing protein [Saccharopolyspora sp. HNM0986]MBK0869639.1 DUF5343 domain-containing protein [Saccharopolyspora sp. HNM0986]